MSKGAVIGLSLAAVTGIAVIIYFKTKTSTGQSPTTVYTGVVGSNTNGMSASNYPYSNVGGAGATASNQSWSNGALRPNISTPLDVNLTNINMLSEGLNSLNSIVNNGGQLFNTISGWFDSSNASDNTYLTGSSLNLGFDW